MLNRKLKKEVKVLKGSLADANSENAKLKMQVNHFECINRDLKAIIKNRETRAVFDGLTNSGKCIYGDDFMAENHFDEDGEVVVKENTTGKDSDVYKQRIDKKLLLGSKVFAVIKSGDEFEIMITRPENDIPIIIARFVDVYAALNVVDVLNKLDISKPNENQLF